MSSQRETLLLKQLHFFSAVLAALCSAESEYFAVCDAGSTGTRLYIFEVDVEADKAQSVFVKKTKPGLSSYAGNPSAALAPLLQLLVEGSQKVPESSRSSTTLSIFGTAGMRLLASEKQQEIWDVVKRGLTSSSSFPFAADSLQARTVSGKEEGLWAVFTANFLTKRMSHDLKSRGGAPVGLMDLGGSSTQIAIPAAAAAKQGAPLGSGSVVHSYLGFGMTHLREQVRRESAGAEDAVCYMRGADVDGLRGTGNALACRALIRERMFKQSHKCQNDEAAEKPCLGDLYRNPSALAAIHGDVDFIAVAGLTYVVDFVRWWLKLHPSAAAADFLGAFPRPSLAELQAAVDEVCAGDYSLVAEHTADEKLAHPFTGSDNAPYRCFQANYILILLGEMYGFPASAHSITFALDVDGEDLEWPLGALLHQRAQALDPEILNEL